MASTSTCVDPAASSEQAAKPQGRSADQVQHGRGQGLATLEANEPLARARYFEQHRVLAPWPVCSITCSCPLTLRFHNPACRQRTSCATLLIPPVALHPCSPTLIKLRISPGRLAPPFCTVHTCNLPLVLLPYSSHPHLPTQPARLLPTATPESALIQGAAPTEAPRRPLLTPPPAHTPVPKNPLPPRVSASPSPPSPPPP